MITSKDNKTIKEVMSLKNKKSRDKLDLFIVEGKKFVDEIPQTVNIEKILVSESFSKNNNLDYYRRKSELIIVKDNIFNNLSDTVSPQGILFVCKKLVYSLEDLNIDKAFFLIGDNLQDPGNIGTLIRTADAAGATCVILSKNSGDIYNPKVIRASASSIFNIPVINEADLDFIFKYLNKNRIKIVSAHLDGELLPYELDFTQKIAILIGNEGSGLSKDTVLKTDYLVKIPMIGKADSLNASIASGILLYEVVRQRIGFINNL